MVLTLAEEPELVEATIQRMLQAQSSAASDGRSRTNPNLAELYRQGAKLRLWIGLAANGLDRVTLAVSPRRVYRSAYDALNDSRTRKPRGGLSRSSDVHFTGSALARLREICRDMGRNNPIVKGLRRMEAKRVVASETKIGARTLDEGWNQTAERPWRGEMLHWLGLNWLLELMNETSVNQVSVLLHDEWILAINLCSHSGLRGKPTTSSWTSQPSRICTSP